MDRIGYKAFDKGLVDMFGNPRELNHVYSVDGPILWNSTHGGNGYHFCTYLEDCFCYFDGFEKDIELTIVRGSGDMIQYDDEYRGNFEMFVSRNIEILKVLSRKEVIEYFLERKNHLETFRKFIYGYPLSIEERSLFLDDDIARKVIKRKYADNKVYEKTRKNSF